MKKRLIAILLVAVLSVSLAACKATSTTTTTITTCVTDANGETKTTTTTATMENGVKTTETTETVEGPETGEVETSEDAEREPVTAENRRDVWEELFCGGAEGTNEAGEICLMAWDDPDVIGYAAIMILSADQTELLLYDLGEVTFNEEWLLINDVDGEKDLPFNVTETEVEDGFELIFQDGDVFTMYFQDQDVILDDMVSIANSL